MRRCSFSFCIHVHWGIPTLLHKVTLECLETIIHGRIIRPGLSSTLDEARVRVVQTCYIEDPIVQARQKEGWNCGTGIIAYVYNLYGKLIRYIGLRDDEFDLDLEDIMVMEAIWLSIQENGRPKYPTYGDSVPSEQYMTEYRCLTPAMPPLAESSSSPSGGLACAIAALAERQQTGRETSGNYNGNISTLNMLPGYNGFTNKVEQVTESYHPAGSSMEVSPEWGINHDSEVAEVVTRSASSDAAEDADRVVALPPQLEIEGGFQTVGGPIVPENFEEQMMLAMAVSLAEARARTSMPGVAWP
ncbi:RING/U-box superfamily protein [Actinidia rufa]|uniref:RING/U-box superfamily protein n=1 Tax=Actinidia rufa TaxID=165716 RepID=A0A7J0G3G3_9ERIC|nr:RING/U-box superfamily protein [Actinidia rufa]